MKEMIIAPSILSADFAKLGQEVDDILRAGANWVHFDVMDYHYVPNLTVGPMVCKAIKPYVERFNQKSDEKNLDCNEGGFFLPKSIDSKTKEIQQGAGINFEEDSTNGTARKNLDCNEGGFFLPKSIDVHLMVEPVDGLIEDFAAAGADIITFHPEASKHVHRSLSLIKSKGLAAGLVLNPATPISVLDHTLELIDVVLLMSVNPGFGGQSFIPETIEKVKAVRNILDIYQQRTGRKIILEIDGGVTLDNIALLKSIGVDAFVAGSAIFNNQWGRNYEGYQQVIEKMRHA